jgi:potassium efflux system protein
MDRTLALILLALLLASPVIAQDSPDPKARLAAEQKRLESYAKPETEEQKRWGDAIRRRIQLLEELIRTEKQIETLPDPEQIEAERRTIESKAATEKAKPEPGRPAFADADEISRYESQLSEAQSARDDARQALTGITNLREAVSTEQKELPGREAKAKQEIERLKADDEYTSYLAESARLELEVTEKRREYLKSVAPLIAPQVSLRQLTLDLRQLELARAEKLESLAQEVAAELRKKESEENRKEKDRETRKAEQEDDPIRQFVRLRKAEAAAAREQVPVAENGSAILRNRIRKRKEEIDGIRAARDHIEKRIEYGDPGVSELLRLASRRAEKNLQELKQKILPERREEATRSQEAYLAVLDRIWELTLPTDDNPTLEELKDKLPEERHAEAEKEFLKIVDEPEGLLSALREKRNALETIQALQGELAALLVEVQVEHQRTLEFARSNLIFSQSSPPVSGATFLGAFREIPHFFRTYTNPDLWIEASDQVRSLARGALVLLTLVLFASAVVFVPRLLQRRKKKAADAELATGFMGFGSSVLRLAIAITPPAGFFIAAVFVRRLDLPVELAEPLPAALVTFGEFLLLRRLSRWFFAARGPGIHRIGIRPENAIRLHRTLSFLAITGMLLAVPASILEAIGQPVANLSRLFDTVWFTIVALTLIVLFGRRGPIRRQVARPGRLLDRTWFLLGPLLALGMLTLVVLDLSGYRLLAWTFLGNVIRSFGLLLGVVALYSFLVRAIGKLAKKVRKRMMREEGYEAALLSSEKVSDQLTRLLAIVIVVVALLALISSWDDQLLLLEHLSGVKIAEIEAGEFLTLYDVFEAILFIAAGHFIVANLSGVYEFLVFPLLGSTDRGGQFVLLALSRYLILLIAYSAALIALGLRLANLAWLLAAASVGIGFGLQEIIANFVSGLIILLERPIQVGDIITVDGTEGTVERISIRSTIVTNWDRQSIVIPNKDFITKKLTNWTRNDDIMRRRIDLRVAFGSDLNEVMRIVDETIRAHPKVLKDPPHRIWMSAYDESGPAFLVFVFTRISDGLDTRAQLYQQFYEKLTEAGIEIPVPKRSVSVVSGPELPGGPSQPPREDEAET